MRSRKYYGSNKHDTFHENKSAVKNGRGNVVFLLFQHMVKIDQQDKHIKDIIDNIDEYAHDQNLRQILVVFQDDNAIEIKIPQFLFIFSAHGETFSVAEHQVALIKKMNMNQIDQ